MDAALCRRLNRVGRQSTRCRSRDYTEGWYFVTICAIDREDVFGNIVNREMNLNVVGFLLHFRWQWMQWFYPNVQLAEWVIMPDHLHGIIRLLARGTSCRGAWPGAPTGPQPVSTVAHCCPSPLWIAPFAVTGKPKPLGQLMGALKTTTTRMIQKLYGFGIENQIWQRNFHDRIIRSNEELQHIRCYIRDNPKNWLQPSAHDKYYYASDHDKNSL